jgi:alpha-1,6-mannosyltransferase
MDVDDRATNPPTPTSTSVLDRASSRLSRLFIRGEALRVRVSSTRTLTERVEAEAVDPGDWSWLRKPAILGFVAVLSICIGASLPSSPFKLEMNGTWFFGASSSGSTWLLLPGVVAVYGGMVLFVRVWFGLYRTLRARPGVPIKKLAYMLALWLVPLMVVAPLFSRDVFSYAAQGELMSRHINPYNYGPGTLGSGPYVTPVDGLWLNTAAPYGPLFLMLAGWSAAISFHHALLTVVLLRFQSVAGLALIAYCVPKLARSFGHDAGPAFVLAVLNPLNLLALVGGAHNDSLMVGLLLAGITAARAKHPVWGVVICALAASIKVPAAIGIVYIAWDWAGVDADWGRRARMAVRSGLVTVAVMGFLSLVSGLGWGWIANLGTPGTVRSWMAPATGIGLLISGTSHVFGVGIGLDGVLTMTRAVGLLAAAAVAVYCLFQHERIGLLPALGITMLAFVLLGPVVQPWYLTWGIIIVAPVVAGRMLYFVLGLSMIVPFIGLTGGAELLSELVHTQPASMVLYVTILWVVAVIPLGRWTTSWRLDASRLPVLTGHAAHAGQGAAAFES